jgi:hypothetical protein
VEAGEPLREIALSYNVDHSTISRLFFCGEQALELARLCSQAMTKCGFGRAPDVVTHEKNRPRAQFERFESSDEATSSDLLGVL